MAVFREIWTLVKVRKSSIEKSAPSARIRRQRRIILLNVRKCLVISIIKTTRASFRKGFEQGLEGLSIVECDEYATHR